MGTDARYEEGPALIIESEHPYRNNMNEFTTVQIPGAVSYSITFHEDTKTEAVYDYIKFFDDETHTEFFGCGKYSGGANGSTYNWPGVGGRPPLVIPASKYVINFKTNWSINDWGFRMQIIPTLLVTNKESEANDAYSLNTPTAVPNISDTGKQFRNGENVHERLYKQGVMKHAEISNQMVRFCNRVLLSDLIQNTSHVG